MTRALLALTVAAVLASCTPVDPGRPGCRDGSTFRPDILPMLNGQCPSRADEGRAADYEIKTWELDCRSACVTAREIRGFSMLLNSPPRPAVAAPVKPPAPPRLQPVPMAGAR